MIQAHVVREKDYFDYRYGLDYRLTHRPGDGAEMERGEITYIYSLFKLSNGGCGFVVSNRADMDAFADRYSKLFSSDFSPWQSDYAEMAKKTCLKRALKYAPVSVTF